MRSAYKIARATLCSVFVALLAGLCLGAAGEGKDALEARVEKGREFFDGADTHEEGVALLEGAAAELTELLEKNPEDAERHFLLGRVFFYLEKDADALRAYDRALALAPEKAEYHFMKGVLLRYLDKPDEAAAALTRATELEPGTAKYWFELGEVRLEQRRPADAIVCYKKASALDPKFARALFKTGVAYHHKGDEDEAVKMWQRTIEVDPNYLNAHYNLGQVCQNQGKCKAARDCFEAVVKIDPQAWRARAKLVQLNQALGDLQRRDAERAALLDLRRQGTVKSLQGADSFCRDQFVANAREVLAFEHFELKGDWALRYNFTVLDEKGEKADYRVSLGSYPKTNALSREMGKIKGNERVFHLDGYFAGGEHRTYGFFYEEPSYDVTRQLVIKVIEGGVDAISGFKPKEGGDAEIWITGPDEQKP